MNICVYSRTGQRISLVQSQKLKPSLILDFNVKLTSAFLWMSNLYKRLTVVQKDYFYNLSY